MCRFEPSYLAVTICKDSESSAKGHGVPYDKKRLDSVYWSRGQKCKGYSKDFPIDDLRGRGLMNSTWAALRHEDPQHYGTVRYCTVGVWWPSAAACSGR